MRRPPTRRLRGDTGATAVEFALVVPVALLLMGSILVFALHMTYAALADHAARVGLKKAVLRTSQGYPSEGAVRTTVDDLFANSLLGDPTSLQVERQDGTVAQGDTVKVTVVYTVPAVRTASGLVPFAGLRESLRKLATVTRVADGRAE